MAAILSRSQCIDVVIIVSNAYSVPGYHLNKYWQIHRIVSFRDIRIVIQNSNSIKCIWKCRPFCPGLMGISNSIGHVDRRVLLVLLSRHPAMGVKWAKLICEIVYPQISSSNGLQWLMMTSSNGSIFRITGPLEFTGHRWISLTKASDAELWWFLWSVWIDGWVNNYEAGDLRRHHSLWRHCNVDLHGTMIVATFRGT